MEMQQVRRITVVGPPQAQDLIDLMRAVSDAAQGMSQHGELTLTYEEPSWGRSWVN